MDHRRGVVARIKPIAPLLMPPNTNPSVGMKLHPASLSISLSEQTSVRSEVGRGGQELVLLTRLPITDIPWRIINR